ncbi:Na+-dependent transporter [Acuticoccus sp. I52.16.1]|uniref:Na+-dependent transporter n=1 Tax=Acuticoccus sp. I52.16.1 TaxID=2928472 RepID=UPI001FD04444|nr:Na+-dependent transporter [Acuticoccus sp. I52.16.1]UOM36431.1 Na+-dependent transporter [Acuticoccus sp. I52.16.1]
MIAALSWLGRQGPRALVVLFIVAMAVPMLGDLLRPYVGEGVFALLVLAFLRIDPERLRATVRQPRVAILSLVWCMIAVPLGALALLRLFGVDTAAPQLFLALMMQVVTMPMMATPSIATMIGLDGTVALVAVVLAGLSMPILAPAIVALADVPVDLPPLRLALLLGGMLAGSAAVGLAIRAALGAGRIIRYREALDGINVIVMFIFAAAVMGDVVPTALQDPWGMAVLGVIAIGANVGLLTVSFLVLRPAGSRTALALAITSSQRNMGLILAVAGAALPETVWLYVAMGQFPIYFAAMVLKRVAGLLKESD